MQGERNAKRERKKAMEEGKTKIVEKRWWARGAAKWLVRFNLGHILAD